MAMALILVSEEGELLSGRSAISVSRGPMVEGVFVWLGRERVCRVGSVCVCVEEKRGRGGTECDCE